MRIEYSKTNNEPNRYFDMNGEEIHAGDYVWMNGRKEKVYALEGNEETYAYLGTDATNPAWIGSGRACPGEYGYYSFCLDDEPYLIKENTKS